MNSHQKSHPKQQATQWLPFGTIKPSDWLRVQMIHDLEHGFVGHLDELVPDLIQRDDIYGANRLTRAVKNKELGVIAKESLWEVQFLWWNSETQSNWLDGMARTALLVDHDDFIKKVRDHIEHLLSTQDTDGYLGIYAPDLRFNFSGENGELWAQASLFRMLLGWYEFTQAEEVLEAVRRAVDVTMNAYAIDSTHPFDVQNDFAGVGHGLVFTDILDRLYQLTGESRYLDYARWMYDEYCRQPLSQDDIQLAHLLDPKNLFKAHGVHTYEQIRSLLTATYASDEPQLEAALSAALNKLEICLTPSGGPIGDEFIAGRKANAINTGYEYCSIHELFDTYTHLMQKTGNLKWADRAEWLFFNAGQGARHPSQPAIAYLKTDNSISMTGPLRPDDPQDEANPQIRYKYSSVHQDVAVCCVPNAGRIMPYYVKAMWMRSADGLVAAFYGASTLQTEINRVPVRISQETEYPFEQEITLKVETGQPVEFTISLRIPNWATSFNLSIDSFQVVDNLVHIRKIWKSGDIVTLRLITTIKTSHWGAEYIVSYGSLLFCLPLDGVLSLGREYAPGFPDMYYSLADPSPLRLCLTPQSVFRIERHRFDPSRPFASLSMIGVLFTADGMRQSTRLIPLGASILRKVTFEMI